jgi:CRISP-associated protein Cas1
MRKLLNTLYVSTEGAYLRRNGLNVVVEVERVEKLRVPLHLLGGVAVFGQASLSAATDRMQDITRRALHENDLDRLRGREGEMAALYFGVFTHVLRTTDPALAFRGHSRRPPMDPPNALLSFIYTLLVHDCCSALGGVGLDPAAGFLHRLRPGRPSLALD